MSTPAILSNPTPADLPAPASEALAHARALIAEQLPLLGRLATVGLEVAMDIERQARESAMHVDPPAPRGGELALAYSRVSRAVRMAIALQSKLIEDLQAMEDAAADRAAGAKTAEVERHTQQDERKVRIESIVNRVANEAFGGDGERVDSLMNDVCDRLDDNDLTGDVLSRPIGEIVAEICRDLGLEPHWGRLSQQAWAQEEMFASSPVSGSERAEGDRSPSAAQSEWWRGQETAPAARPLSCFATAPPQAGEHAARDPPPS